jgi:hypothetical protein
VITDFPQTYKEWLDNKEPKDVSEEETQRVDEKISVRSTRSKASESSSSSKLVEPGSTSPRKGDAPQPNKQTSPISTRRQKRQADSPAGEEPKSKIEKKDEITHGLEQHSDLITVNQTDLSKVVAGNEAVLEREQVMAVDSEEDDVAAELPDGFYSTSRKFYNDQVSCNV